MSQLDLSIFFSHFFITFGFFLLFLIFVLLKINVFIKNKNFHYSTKEFNIKLLNSNKLFEIKNEVILIKNLLNN